MGSLKLHLPEQLTSEFKFHAQVCLVSLCQVSVYGLKDAWEFSELLHAYFFLETNLECTISFPD